MAASISRLGFTALRYASQTSARRKNTVFSCPNQAFHSTPLHRRPEDQEDSSASAKPQRQPFKFSLDDLNDEERTSLKSASSEERQQILEIWRGVDKYFTRPEVESELQGAVSQAAYETAQETPKDQVPRRRIKPGFFAMGEDEEQDTGEDEEFDGDDITSLGHSELEQHREMRHYAMIAAWEMPLLSSTLLLLLLLLLLPRHHCRRARP